jgi:hypothetical protein
MKPKSEFENFDTMMGKVLKASHDNVKAALDAEKKKKPPKKRASASGRVSRGKD